VALRFLKSDKKLEFPSPIIENGGGALVDNSELMARFVRSVERKYFHGVLPPFPSQIAAAVMECLPALKEADNCSRRGFLEEFLPAIESHIAAQKCEWSA
jgi:hypothetical protein